MKKFIIKIIIPLISMGLIVFYIIYNVYNKECNISNLNNKQNISWGIKEIINTNLLSEFTGKNIKIAILDSGINFEHPDFSYNIKRGYNTINPNDLPRDDNGHGTLVAGIIAAQNNNFGVLGIAPDAEIYPVKVLDKYGEGDINNIVQGINWCIENKIQIINMSFAIFKDNSILYNSIKKAVNAGIIVVASAGNSYGGEVGYPAAYKEVISVTAINKNNRIAKVSPIGKIDFCAPGENIISTTSRNSYEKCEGTSIAAPYVSGIISIILHNPEKFNLHKKVYSYNDIYNILSDMSEHIGRKNVFGKGFIKIRDNKIKSIY